MPDTPPVRYDLFPAALGAVLVAATPEGVCALSLGDDAAALEADLRAAFPEADVRRDDAALAAHAAAVRRYLGGEAGALAALPLDLRGTAFQLAVWQALRAIPPGATRTYRALAVQLGRPTAARAVAQACARNPVALAVPCHRAVGADGAVRGYRWGPERKRRLLALEGAVLFA